MELPARYRFRAPLCVGFVALTLATNGSAPSRAGIDPPAAKGDTQTGITAPPAAVPNTTAAIDGFRSVRFGMSEEQVRTAIHSDFPEAISSLTSAINPSEKTTVLSLMVPDLLPRTGKAHISYIFGYRSKKLIQVNILWISDRSRAGDEAIIGAANSLRDYFLSEKFRPDSIVANQRLAANTILVFRGSDEQKRTILLVLSGTAAGAHGSAKPEAHSAPLTLELSYIEDAAHPDVFKISRGQF